MTHDFLEDLVQACEREKVPYLLIVGSRWGKDARVKSNLENWKCAPVNSTLREDIHQLLEVTIFEDDEK